MIEHIQPISEKEPRILRSAQLERRKETRPEGDPSQDCTLIDDVNGVYGVFDGLGAGSGEPRAAAVAARGAIHSALREARMPESTEHMKSMLVDALLMGRQAVIEEGRFGMTTVTVAWFAAIEGQLYCAIGNAGDSRSFVYDRTMHDYQPITKAQNSGRHVTNYFGPHPIYEGMEADEVVVFPFEDSMRLVLCTDGITGDTDWGMPTRDDFLDAFSRLDAGEAALALCNYSRKVDDKSIVIVDRSS